MDKSSETVSSSNKIPRLRDILLLDSPQVILSLVIALSFYIFISIPNFWQSITGGNDTKTSSQYITDWLTQTAPWLYSTYSTIVGGRAVQVLFWLLAGATTYLLIWFIGSILINIRNDIVADSYIHPKFYNRRYFWLSVTFRKLFFVLIFAILIVYLPVALGLLVQLSDLGYEAIIMISSIDNIRNLIGAILTGLLLVHVFFILLRLTINAWNYIYKDL